MMNANILQWLQKWYQNNCDDDWEHQYGVSIVTIDNPGWSITIDLDETPLEELAIEYALVQESEDNWYGMKIEDGKFEGAGDPRKLEFLLIKFREIVEAHSPGVVES